MTDELDGMAALVDGVRRQVWPHTMDAREWAQEWMATIAENPSIPHDYETMVGWFANAIMAGYDTATIRGSSDDR